LGFSRLFDLRSDFLSLNLSLAGFLLESSYLFPRYNLKEQLTVSRTDEDIGADS
jgi:hypothetical protein